MKNEALQNPRVIVVQKLYSHRLNKIYQTFIKIFYDQKTQIAKKNHKRQQESFLSSLNSAYF